MKSERFKSYSNQNNGSNKIMSEDNFVPYSATNFHYRSKSYLKHLSGDPCNSKEIVNISSSSNSSTTDLTSTFSNSSPSSLSISSDNSEFNEVEQIIEEYFIKKISNSITMKSETLKNMLFDRPNSILNDSKHFNIYREEMNIYKNNKIHTAEVSVQVSEKDLNTKVFKILKPRFLLRSCSYTSTFMTEIWMHQDNFQLYLNETGIDNELTNIFKKSIYLRPKLKKNKFSENVDDANYYILQDNYFDESSYLTSSRLSVDLKQISPLKAVFVINKTTSQILLMNDKAKYLFKLQNMNQPLYFNSFLVYQFKYAKIFDYCIDNDGRVCYLPSKMILCKDFHNCLILVSLRLQKLKTECTIEMSNDDNIIAVLEPLIIRKAYCLVKDKKIYGYNDVFKHMFEISEHQIKEINFSNHLSSNLIANNLEFINKNKYVCYNVLRTCKHNQSLHFVSQKKMISSYEANLLIKILKISVNEILTDKDYLQLYYLWFHTNLTDVIVISSLGEIIDFDPYIPILLGYSDTKLFHRNINTVLKFNAIEFGPKDIPHASGKYDATLFHSNGSMIKCVIWINKQDDINDITYILWVLLYSNDSSFQEFQLHTEYDVESVVNLNDLILQFTYLFYKNYSVSKLTDGSIILNENKITCRNQSSIISNRTFSLPELNNYFDIFFNSWSTTDFNETDNISKSRSLYLTKKSDLFYRHYKLEKIIGKGAFGFVRLVKSLINGEEFVVKFIRKNKLSLEHMVNVPLEDLKIRQKQMQSEHIFETTNKTKIKSDIYVLVPREIWMLCKLNHPNIVNLYDWYEGTDHFQMIMPKHGVGMDLFEFIDRSPVLNEPLVSYIFRQLVDAVSYLHGIMVAHRDIKDENIILDNQFNIKLIDFGAAVRVENGQKFRTFCGTMEFCSPEILLGKEYDCFHADIWSMGITLYTIIFGENPFYDFEETINAVLKPPKKISSQLYQVLSWLLEPNPQNRITIDNLMRHPWIMQEIDIKQYSFDKIVSNPEFSGNIASDFRKYSVDDAHCSIRPKTSPSVMFSKL